MCDKSSICKQYKRGTLNWAILLKSFALQNSPAGCYYLFSNSNSVAGYFLFWLFALFALVFYEFELYFQYKQFIC